MTLIFNTLLSEQIKKMLNETLDDRKDNLASGGGIAEFTDYWCAVGFIRGLKYAIELCDEARSKLEER
jgi:hypothetical protein